MIVVTGGAGLIGSCLVRHLNEQGRSNLVIVDNLGKSEKWKNLVRKNFEEIVHKDDLFTWLEGREKDIEAIIHLGACSSTVETDCNYLLENNTRFSMRLATYALKQGIRFIYASSAATYGDGALGFSDDEHLLECLAPLNMYGYSKHLFDLWLKRRGALDKVVGLKYFNVFGPNEYHKGRMGSALLKMVPDALTKGSISLFKSNDPQHFSDGEQLRDFLYVKDAAAMTAAFLDNDLTGIYNVGAGQARSWNDLARSMTTSLPRPFTIEYVDMPADLAKKYQNYTCADMSKWQKASLPSAAYTLEKAVEDYLTHYLLDHNYR